MTKPKAFILGGGVGGVTAAFELSRGNWQQHFESITLYQRGWRLGGKGASGRNADRGQRIEEHGLHIWLGFYENGFRMMRQCYDEADRPAGHPMRTIDDAFEPSSCFVVMEDRPEGWLPWVSNFPTDDTLPGTGAKPLPSPWEYVLEALNLAVRMLRQVRSPSPLAKGPPSVTITPVNPPPPSGSGSGSGSGVTLTPAWPPLGAVLDDAWKWLVDVAETTADTVLAGALTLASALQMDPAEQNPADHDHIAALIDDAADLARAFLPAPSTLSDDRRRHWYVADVLMACVRGVLREGLLTDPRGLDAIDDYDFVDWVIHHGADPESARSGLIITTVYDLQFAYEEGDPARPSCSAAAALRGLARMFFTYRGAIAWKMRAGMGDVVFGPLYEVLKKRGVDFQFFHRVHELKLSPDNSRVAEIVMARQAGLVNTTPGARYEPLIDPGDGHKWCWPSKPDDAQLTGVTGVPAYEFESLWHPSVTEQPTTLAVGQDDVVVLAIPVGAHPFVCKELIGHSPKWKASAERIGTIHTQAFQLWLNVLMEQLGVDLPGTTTGGYLEPFDTWADMRQLISAERWPPDSVRAIAYFCNAMPTPPGIPDPAATTTQTDADTVVEQNALHFLRRHMAELWPGAVQRYPTDFRWELLYGGTSTGPARFKDQYWRANVDPSERYVLPLPGTARHRLNPRDSGYSNLFLAGDWTECGINAGCVEAAVISGMLAAHAITGGDHPPLAEIVGYRHW